MMDKKYQIQALAEDEIRQNFQCIKTQTDKDGKHILAFYCQLVDDYFAVGNFAITQEDFDKYNGKVSILEAIGSGKCPIYKPEHIVINTNSNDWLDNQTLLYKEVYLWSSADEESYENVRKDFEECLIWALKNCDKEGVFGNRAENGILLFVHYGDYYDDNGAGSLLDRSARELNQPSNIQKIIGDEQ